MNISEHDKFWAMKTNRIVLAVVSASFGALMLTGCSDIEARHTSPYQPGPVIGREIGFGAGIVAGNVAGTGVGIVEGAAAGAAAPFDPSYRMVRHWRKEITADGRVIQVPYDLLVDRYGRPVGTVDRPFPSANASSPATNAPVQVK
jgi:hypothetical protein